jgi:hypothetical protein
MTPVSLAGKTDNAPLVDAKNERKVDGGPGAIDATHGDPSTSKSLEAKGERNRTTNCTVGPARSLEALKAIRLMFVPTGEAKGNNVSKSDTKPTLETKREQIAQI